MYVIYTEYLKLLGGYKTKYSISNEILETRPSRLFPRLYFMFYLKCSGFLSLDLMYRESSRLRHSCVFFSSLTKTSRNC